MYKKPMNIQAPIAWNMHSLTNTLGQGRYIKLPYLNVGSIFRHSAATSHVPSSSLKMMFVQTKLEVKEGQVTRLKNVLILKRLTQ